MHMLTTEGTRYMSIQTNGEDHGEEPAGVITYIVIALLVFGMITGIVDIINARQRGESFRYEEPQCIRNAYC